MKDLKTKPWRTSTNPLRPRAAQSSSPPTLPTATPPLPPALCGAPDSPDWLCPPLPVRPLFFPRQSSPPSECTGRPSGRLLSSPLFSPLLPRRARLPRRAALTHNHRSPDHPSPPAPPKPSPPHPACPDQIRREVRLPSAHFAKGAFRRRTISTKTPLPTPREAPLAPLIVLADLQVGSSPPPSAFFPPPLHPSQTPSS